MNTQQAIDWQLLAQVLTHLRIAHHVEGRLRVHFLPSIMRVLPAGQYGSPEAWLARIPGVMETRLNLAAASLVIQYDAARIQPQWWERLLCVSNSHDLPALFEEIGAHRLVN